MIYSTKEISNNWLYAQVMEQINQLHEELGSPEMSRNGPTTESRGFDVMDGDTWSAEAIGDWDGKEGDVAAWAQERMEEVLNAIDRGRFVYYASQGAKWENFANQAYDLVRGFNSYDAYNRLCDEWDEHQD